MDVHIPLLGSFSDRYNPQSAVTDIFLLIFRFFFSSPEKSDEGGMVWYVAESHAMEGHLLPDILLILMSVFSTPDRIGRLIRIGTDFGKCGQLKVVRCALKSARSPCVAALLRQVVVSTWISVRTKSLYVTRYLDLVYHVSV
jgi:hypothetical protein